MTNTPDKSEMKAEIAFIEGALIGAAKCAEAEGRKPTWRELATAVAKDFADNTRASSRPPAVEAAAPFEELCIEAYKCGWNDCAETIVEDSDHAVEAPHKDAMGEGCGTFMGAVWPKLSAAIAALQAVPASGGMREMREAAAALVAHIDALADGQCGPFAIRNSVANSRQMDRLRTALKASGEE